MAAPITSRFDFPKDEKKYPWLSMLLDAYHILDIDNEIGINEESARRGQEVACGESCYHCCLRPVVPITGIELAGISWFSCEQLTGEVRLKVKGQFLAHKETTSCPFLIEKTCSIYPVRPLACRSFHVFGEKCNIEEDLWETRRKDVWSHGKETALKMALTVLTFGNITDRERQKAAYESGFTMNKAINMHEYNWAQIQNSMLQFDSVVSG